MSAGARVSFGIKTSQVCLSYAEILALWKEVDTLPVFEHAWLSDHVPPLGAGVPGGSRSAGAGSRSVPAGSRSTGARCSLQAMPGGSLLGVRGCSPGDVQGRALEAWTLLGALAAQTTRIRLGVMATDNRLRPPAVLAKLAATVDVLSGGRLVFGIGAGSGQAAAGGGGERSAVGGEERRDVEAAANGAAAADANADADAAEAAADANADAAADAVTALAEALAVARLMWSETEPFDFDGRIYRLRGAMCEPKPLQRPAPPVLVRAGAQRDALRVVAEQADVWGCPARTPEELVRMGGALDERCAAIGRDPATVARCVQLAVDGDDASRARDRVLAFVAAGATHVVFANPLAPSLAGKSPASWLAEKIAQPVLRQLG